jgi:putative ABC transport system permease protein
MGHSEVAETARNRGVRDGVFFDADDIRQARRVALIGPHASKALFGDASPIGEKVFFNNVALEIIGELEPAGVDPHGRDLDNELRLPYTLLKDKILGRSYLSATTFVIADDRLGDLDGVAEEITQVMRRQHDLADGARNDFTVIHSGVMLRMVDKAYRTFDIFLPITVSVAFLASALLILGIMAAVVKERTREIGLRKALGAMPASLRWMIVAEVLVLSVIGTAIGTAIALATLLALEPMFASKFGIERLQPSLMAMVIAAGLALLSGFLGALLPANRAARMHPVAALA